MATLNIEGRKVTVDDSFLQLSPEQQNATVEEIAGSLGHSSSPQQAPAPQATFADRFTGGGTSQWTATGYNPQAEANAIEAARGTSGFTDASGSIIKGIPFGDEIMSAAGAPIRAARDWYRGDGFSLGRAYNEAQALETELQRRRDERSPIASTVGAVAGGMPIAAQAAGAGLSLTQGAAPTLASMAGRGAAEGAIYGGLYGAGEGDGFKERFVNAGTGALAGGALGGATGALGRIGAAKVDRSTFPTADDLKAAASAAYQRADDAGVVYSKDAMGRVADDLRQQFYDFGYHPELQGGAKVALSEIERLRDQNTTLKGLDVARQVASGAYIPGNKKNNALTTKVIDALDNLVASPQSGDILTGQGSAAAEALPEARSLFHQASKLDTVNNLMEEAGLRAGATYSGGNIDNRTRQNLLKILTSDKLKRGFSEEELAAVKDAVIGSPGQNMLRLVGRLSPEGGGLMSMLHLLGGSATGGATLPFAAAGAVAKRAADSMSLNKARLVEALIASGGQLPQAQLGANRQALIDVLTRGGAQMAPEYISR